MNPAQQPGVLEMLMPFAFIFVIFYFLILRPQTKRMKEQTAMLQKLQEGDAVITQSGILGTIAAINESLATLEIAPNTKIKVLRKQIAGLQAQLLTSEAGKKA